MKTTLERIDNIPKYLQLDMNYIEHWQQTTWTIEIFLKLVYFIQVEIIQTAAVPCPHIYFRNVEIVWRKRKKNNLRRNLRGPGSIFSFLFATLCVIYSHEMKTKRVWLQKKKKPFGLKTLCRLRLVHVTKLLRIILSWRIESHEHVIMLYGNVITKRRRAPLWEGRASDTSKIPHSHII